VLRQGGEGHHRDIITKTGLVNVDFADVLSVMMNGRHSPAGIGRGFRPLPVHRSGQAA